MTDTEQSIVQKSREEGTMPTFTNAAGVERPKFHESEKYKLWLKYFTDKNNKDTYFNATRSAILAYGYDEETQYMTAAVTGFNNRKKTKELAYVYAEHKGLTFREMMDFAVTQMKETKNKAWWDSLMELFGYKEEKSNVEINVPIQINNEIEKDFDKYR